MKPVKSVVLVIAGALPLLGLAGCGPTSAERAARERERLQHEEKARQETERANQAITDLNKKRFGKKAPPAPPPEPDQKP